MKWTEGIWKHLRSFAIAHIRCILLTFGLTGICLALLPADVGSWIQTGWNWLSEGESNSGTIRNIGLVIAGAFALLVAVWRSKAADDQAKAAQRQAFTAQEGLAEDRFQKGAEMLGSSILSVRVGGIYTLRSLSKDMPQIHGPPVKRLLCAFIRNPTEDASLVFDDESPDAKAPLLRDDVKAALEAVADRHPDEVENERKMRIVHDIVRSKLRKLVLMQGNFANFNLSGADLSRSILVRGDFTNSILAFADLSGTDVGGANFYNTTLIECNLSGTRFNIASVRPDETTGSIVARNLTQAQLDQAVADPDNPPILDGVIDPETGKQLVWRGGVPKNLLDPDPQSHDQTMLTP